MRLIVKVTGDEIDRFYELGEEVKLSSENKVYFIKTSV